MWKEFFAGRDLLELPLISMALFAVTFATALFLARRVHRDDPRALLPLDRDVDVAARRGAPEHDGVTP